MKQGILLLCVSLALTWAISGEASELVFPIEKSRIQILPQRFEYQLLNKDRFRIGNVTVDATKMDFQILPGAKDRYKLRFRWPVGLLDRGEIAIKDNSGKGIWFQKIQPEQITFNKNRSIATYETEAEVPSLIRLVQFYPFIRFCVHREEPKTKTYLCSKDLYLRRSRHHSQIRVIQKDSFRPDSYVEINGRIVDNQGVIFLNSPSEFISMRVLLLSGASLEVDTRMKEINFKNVYLTEDEQQIVVRAQGSEPVNPESVEKPAPGEWQTRLDAERPYTYVKGEGDLPLRQEFLIQGDIRKKNVRVEISSGATSLTLKKELNLTLRPTKGLKLAASDQNTKLEKISNEEYQWTLLNLQKGEDNRRYVKVISESGEEYFAAHDVRRLAAFDATARLMIPLWAQAHLLFTPSENWGFSAQSDNQFAQSVSSEPVIKSMSIAGQYRWSKGTHLQEPAYIAEAYVQSLSFDSLNQTLYGLGLQAELKSPTLWNNHFAWTFAKLRIPLGNSNSDWPVQSSYEAEVSVRDFFSATSYWELGVRTHNYQFSPSSGDDFSTSKTLVFIGTGWTF